MRVTEIPIVIGALGTLSKGARRVGNRRINRDHPNYCIVEIGQNTEKSPGNDEKTCGLTDFSEKPSANADIKNCVEHESDSNTNWD